MVDHEVGNGFREGSRGAKPRESGEWKRSPCSRSGGLLDLRCMRLSAPSIRGLHINNYFFSELLFNTNPHLKDSRFYADYKNMIYF